MSQKRKIKLFHIGTSQVAFSSGHEYPFDYYWIPLDYNFDEDPLSYGIIKNQAYNPKLHAAVFIIENFATLLTQPDLLKLLPAHQIVYDDQAHLSPEIHSLLEIKGAFPKDLSNIYEVFSFASKEFTVKQEGFKLSMDYLKIAPHFQGQVDRQGNSYCQLTGDFPADFQQTISWTMTHVIGKGSPLEFFPEVEILSGNIELLFKIHLLAERENRVLETIEIPYSAITDEAKVKFESASQDAYFALSLYVRGGEGQFKVGQMHIRKALADESSMLPGGRVILDEENLDGEVLYYFNPADFKPPLAVYFSGYRSAEGFEGRGMMGSMGCPFLLIADPRLEGGNFYMGSPEFEQRIANIILDKLNLLGFQRSDLILSGLSMGTFGALYYASDLTPNSIIIGKPLANIGTVAINERVNRPDGFPTSLDILYYNTGEVSIEAAKQLDERFWHKFSSGDYTHSTFAIAYMEHDDYDKEAFPMLFDVLKEKFPKIRLLYKGLIGRHNDNSPGINKWFLRQYYNTLTNVFNRTIKTKM